MLYEIHDILVRNNTNYKVILNPIYDQLLFSTEDKEFLLTLFGNNNIADFSGKNRITNDYIASELMRISYECDSIKQQHMLDSLYNY